MTTAPRRRWFRSVAILATIAIGYAIGLRFRLGTLPADPTGQITSPVVGGVLGLVIALTILVAIDRKKDDPPSAIH